MNNFLFALWQVILDYPVYSAALIIVFGLICFFLGKSAQKKCITDIDDLIDEPFEYLGSDVVNVAGQELTVIHGISGHIVEEKKEKKVITDAFSIIITHEQYTLAHFKKNTNYLFNGKNFLKTKESNFTQWTDSNFI